MDVHPVRQKSVASTFGEYGGRLVLIPLDKPLKIINGVEYGKSQNHQRLPNVA